jgi:hypothetical protein
MIMRDTATFAKMSARLARREGPPQPVLDWLRKDLASARGVPTAFAKEVPAATPAPARWMPSLAWLTSVCSTWAYADRVTFSEVLRLCVGPVKVHAVRAANPATLVDTQAYFVRSEALRLGILVFRGTEFGVGRMTDVFTDIGVAPVPYRGGQARVHGGFYRAVSCVWHDVLDVLEEHGLELDAFIVTGHSLGGALAVLASALLFCDLSSSLTDAPPLARYQLEAGGRAAALRDELWDAFAGLYTFGQPMVGDRRFADLCRPCLEPLTFRHVYCKDWVPTLPPRETGEFVHFGRQYASDDGPWQECPSVAQSTLWAAPIAAVAFAAQQFPSGRRLALPYSLADHVPQNYVDASKNGVPQAPAFFP